MKRKICIVLLVMLLYSLQGTFCKAISLGGISPNILIILPVCFGYFKGSNEGMFTGVVSGMMYDLYYADIYGFSILVFAVLGYIAGIFNGEYNEKRNIIPIILIAVGNFAYEFFVYVGGFLLHNRLDVLFFCNKIIIPSTIYTTLVGFMMFRLLLLCDKVFEHKVQRKVNDYAKGSD